MSKYREYDIPANQKLPSWSIDFTGNEVSQSVAATKNALITADLRKNNYVITADSDEKEMQPYLVVRKVVWNPDLHDYDVTYSSDELDSAYEAFNPKGKVVGNPSYTDAILSIENINEDNPKDDNIYVCIPHRDAEGNIYNSYVKYGENTFKFKKLGDEQIDPDSKLSKTIYAARHYLEYCPEVANDNETFKVLVIKPSNDKESALDQPQQLIYDKLSLEFFAQSSDNKNMLLVTDATGKVIYSKLSADFFPDNGLHGITIKSPYLSIIENEEP